jgi:two-component system, OmpR family, KDP operon response regulator KdpE
VREFHPDVVLLDLVLPDLDGIAVTRAVRARSEVPIILLSAVGDERSKVAALDEGADDYLTKPFGMEELLARVRVALRRRAGDSREPVLRSGPIAMDLATRAVTVGGAAVHLTPKEFELCRLLLRQEGRVLTQRYILAEVWGPEYVDDGHILRTFVHQLRTKLEAAQAGAGTLIVNDPGVGYRLRGE